jgi:hypothetical protein
MATAIPAGLRDDDPTLGIRNVKVRATGGFHTWTEEEIAQFEVEVPRSRLAAWLIGAWLAQGRMSSIRRGQLHGPPNRGVFRPRFIEGSATLRKSRRSKTACRRRDGSPRQKQGENKNWQTQRKG